MKRRYYVERQITVDGRAYHPGEIVLLEEQQRVPFVRLIEEEQEIQKRPQAPVSKWCELEGQPDVSVIVTMHNHRAFAAECIDGFIRQTARFRYEIIAVVDADNQGTAQMVRELFPQVRVREINAANACAARNIGMRMARGRYIAFFDGDDVPYSEYLVRLRNAIESTGAQFSYARFDHDLYMPGRGRIPRCNAFEYSDTWSRFSPVANTAIMILRNDRTPWWDERFEIMQDFAFHLAMLEEGMRGTHVRDRLWRYRMHAGSAWSQSNIEDKRKRAEAMLVSDYGWIPDSGGAEATFVSLISRDDVIKDYAKQIKGLGVAKRAHWMVIIDSADQRFVDGVMDALKREEHRFMSTRYYVTNDKSMADEREHSFEERGMRIADFISAMINQAAASIGGTPWIFMVEDDTIAPRGAYTRLRELAERTGAAYASGVEIGRGSSRHTGVCWLKTNDKNEFVERHIPPPPDGSPVVEIGGGGWYCWVGNVAQLRKFVMQGKFRCDGDRSLGPDVMMVHDMTAMGMRCVADFGIRCKHWHPKLSRYLTVEEGKGYVVRYAKRDRRGPWGMHIIPIELSDESSVVCGEFAARAVQ